MHREKELINGEDEYFLSYIFSESKSKISFIFTEIINHFENISKSSSNIIKSLSVPSDLNVNK